MKTPNKPLPVSNNPGCSLTSILVAVLAVLVIGGFVVWQLSQVGARTGPVLTDAYIDSQVYVENRLKAPSTATFPYSGDPSAVTITDLGNHRAQVAAYVDAQNSFGAMIRTHYVAVLTWASGSNWNLESLKME